MPAESRGTAEVGEVGERCSARDHIAATSPIWDVVSRRHEDRQGPDADRIGDHCLTTDLQFMDAPLFRVRDTVGDGAPLIAALPGIESRHDSTQGTTVEADEYVLGSQIVADYQCIYTVSDRGTLAAGFVRAEHLERVPDPVGQSLDQLTGYWVEDGWDPSPRPKCVPDAINISPIAQAEFVLEGHASWCCGCDEYDVHLGGVVGSVDFCGGEGGLVEGDCVVGFVQRGPFLMVWDDMSCGGTNVAFRGIYLRSAEPLPEVSSPAR